MQMTLPVALLAAASAVEACELKLLPESLPLRGPGASHRMLLVETMHGAVTADLTAQGEFSSSAPAVAVIDKDGTVRAVGDGEAILTARFGPRSVRATVRVAGTGAPPVHSFRNEVNAVLTRNACNSGACHGALAGKGGLKLSLRGYDLDADHFAITRQAQGRRIDKTSPEDSLLLAKATAAVKHGGGMKITPDTRDHRILREWIAAGAPARSDADPVITELQVVPAAATLKPGAKLQILARAVYSDGSIRDVTHWTKWSSSDDLVAAVDADGRVTAAGNGEAAIVAVFDNRPATVRITSPQATVPDPRVFADAPRNNFVDELVLAKLAKLNIPPSPTCTDHEFVRRAYLDAAGILPTPQETQAFVADKSPDKRARLIDALLARPEFTDYWAYKWGEMLLVSSKLPGPAMWSFHEWVRRSVADNKPWDRFAREILTAKGSTLDNGAANYYVLHKDITELTEATTVTFLGMSLTCARCHNHPLEKWTQTQYYGLANTLARVKLKNGDRPGEVIVYAASSGDVPHPRTGRPVPPAPLDAKPIALDDPADRRTYLADWLTQPDNPFFARSTVNRVWRNFLGRGLFESEDDLRATNPATNEELLAALSADFVKNGYDMRRLVRLIMSSAAYQRSSRPVPGNADDDRYYSRYLVRRLPAEVILDAYSQITGVPTSFQQSNAEGQPRGPKYPDGTRALQLPDSRTVSRFLDSFGRPERAQACSCERNQESSVGQSLHLFNGRTLNDKLRAADGRIADWLKRKITDDAAIDEAFLLALCRPPTDAERARLKETLAEAGADRRAALEDLLWGVCVGKEFLFNH
jgi:hypothetical protein